MTCKDIIKQLSYAHIHIDADMREHLRHCADCRLLMRITGLPKVIEMPAPGQTQLRRASR